jgi:hypothetical protein
MSIIKQINDIVCENSLLKARCNFPPASQQAKVDALTQENNFLRKMKALDASHLIDQSGQIALLMKATRDGSGQITTQPFSAQAMELAQENHALKTERNQQLAIYQDEIGYFTRKNRDLREEHAEIASQLASQSERMDLLTQRIQNGFKQGTISTSQPVLAQVKNLTEENRFLRVELGFQQASYQAEIAGLTQVNGSLKKERAEYDLQLTCRAQRIAFLTKAALGESGKEATPASQLEDLALENCFLKTDLSHELSGRQAKAITLTRENDFLEDKRARSISQLILRTERIDFLTEMACDESRQAVVPVAQPTLVTPTPLISRVNAGMLTSASPGNVMYTDAQRLLIHPDVKIQQTTFNIDLDGPESDAIAITIEPAVIRSLRDNAFIQNCFPRGVPASGNVGLELIVTDQEGLQVFCI